MITRVRRCVPHERLLDALEIMGEENMDWVAVVEGHDNPQFLGWVTARAALVFLGVYDRRPSEVMCRELTDAPPATLAPGEELEAARQRVAAAGVRRLPVVEAGKLVGILAAQE